MHLQLVVLVAEVELGDFREGLPVVWEADERGRVVLKLVIGWSLWRWSQCLGGGTSVGATSSLQIDALLVNLPLVKDSSLSAVSLRRQPSQSLASSGWSHVDWWVILLW